MALLRTTCSGLALFCAFALLFCAPVSAIWGWNFGRSDEPSTSASDHPSDGRQSINTQLMYAAVLPSGRKGSELVVAGRSHYSSLERRSLESGRVGSCYRDALDVVQRTCKTLTDSEDDRIRLAVKLTGCHLAKSGAAVSQSILDATLNCGASTVVSECTKELATDAILFPVYTSFLLHAEALCAWVAQDAFHEQVQTTIGRLAVQGEATVDTLLAVQNHGERLHSTLELASQEHREMQQSVQAFSEKSEHAFYATREKLEGLQSSVGDLAAISRTASANLEKLTDYQADLVSGQEVLMSGQKSLAASVEGVAETASRSAEIQQSVLLLQRQAHTELSELVQDQSQAINVAVESVVLLEHRSADIDKRLAEHAQTIDRVHDEVIGMLTGVQNFQQAFFGEFLDLAAALFYVCAFLLATFSTNSRRTSDARLPLYFGLLLCCAVERGLLPAVLRFLVGVQAQQELLAIASYYIRRTYFAYYIVIWSWLTYAHVDSERESFHLLHRVIENQEKFVNMWKTKAAC